VHFASHSRTQPHHGLGSGRARLVMTAWPIGRPWQQDRGAVVVDLDAACPVPGLLLPGGKRSASSARLLKSIVLRHSGGPK
jgi:hypothetical protein